MRERIISNQHHIVSAFWLFIALILLIACSDTVNSQVISDEYGSVSLARFPGGKITISGIEIDLAAEEQIAHARLYLPETEEAYEIGVADGQTITVAIKNGAGEKYQEMKRHRRNLKELIESENDRWGKHFLGNYYYEPARKKIQATSWLSLDGKREIYFPALEKYKAAISTDPFFPLSHLNLAYIYSELGEYERAAKECKLAEKYNLSLVPNLASGSYSDVFGVSRFITSLRQKLQKSLGGKVGVSEGKGDTQYDVADDKIDMSDYKPTEREIKPEVAKREQDVESFVLSVEKHLNGDDKVRLYNSLGYYYQTKGAYHLALVNYRKGLKFSSQFPSFRRNTDLAAETKFRFSEENKALELKKQNLSFVKPETLSTIYQNIQAAYTKLGWLEAEEITLRRGMR